MSEEKSTDAAAKPAKKSIDPGLIKPGLKVLCKKGNQLGVVEQIAPNKASIKLGKDDKGVHHFIPLAWVTRVDGKAHLDRPHEQAMREWSTSAIKA